MRTEVTISKEEIEKIKTAIKDTRKALEGMGKSAAIFVTSAKAFDIAVNNFNLCLSEDEKKPILNNKDTPKKE